MHKKVLSLLIASLLIILTGCVSNQAKSEEKITPEIYYTIVSDSQGYIVNQVGDLIVSRTLFVSDNGDYEPYYIEMISETIAQDNKELFLNNDDTTQVVVDIYNDFAQEMQLDSRMDRQQLSSVDFKVIQEGNNLNLVSTSKVDIEDNTLSVYELAIESNGLDWISSKQQ